MVYLQRLLYLWHRDALWGGLLQSSHSQAVLRRRDSRATRWAHSFRRCVWRLCHRLTLWFETMNAHKGYNFLVALLPIVQILIAAIWNTLICLVGDWVTFSSKIANLFLTCCCGYVAALNPLYFGFRKNERSFPHTWVVLLSLTYIGCQAVAGNFACRWVDANLVNEAPTIWI